MVWLFIKHQSIISIEKNYNLPLFRKILNRMLNDQLLIHYF